MEPSQSPIQCVSGAKRPVHEMITPVPPVLKFRMSGVKLALFMLSPCLWVPLTTAWRVLRLWMEERPPIWRVAANKLNKQSRTAEKGDPPDWGLGEALTTPLREKQNVKNYS